MEVARLVSREQGDTGEVDSCLSDGGCCPVKQAERTGLFLLGLTQKEEEGTFARAIGS